MNGIESKPADALGITSMVLGIVSLVLLLFGCVTACFFAGIPIWFAIPLALVGLIVGFFGRSGFKIAGLILNSVTLVLSLVAGILMLAGVGAILFAVANAPKNNPKWNVGPGPAPFNPPGQVRPPGPPIVVKAEDLLAEYKDNIFKADQKYKNKLVEVSGTIEQTGKEDFFGQFVQLRTAGPLPQVFGVRCYFPPERAHQVNALQRGQAVTVEGVCEGWIAHVKLRDCVLK